MKTSKWGKLHRLLASGLLGLTAILGSVFTVQANEAPAVPAISQWSISTLHEGEKYGIFPLAWYYDGTFQKPITADKYEALLNATAAKLDALGLKKRGASSAPSVAASQTITRDAVLHSLYNTLAQYELPEAFEIAKDKPIDYLQKKGIVNGTKNGLELEQPCTTEQAAVLASRLIAYTYDTAQGGAKGLMWKVTKGDNTLYLLGSIHLGIPEMYPMQKNIREAFQASDTLWVEANLVSRDQETLEYFTNSMTFSDGSMLKDHVSQETYEKLQKATAKLNLPSHAYDSVKPWAISTNLSLMTLLSSPDDMVQASTLGIDMYFLQSALLTGKPIHELEGMKLQADIFNNVSLEEQEKDLNEMLDTILNPTAETIDSAKEFNQWQQLWAKGDLDGFTQSFTKSQQYTETDSAKRLFGERDKNMAAKLAELLEKEGKSTTFVVIGAGHFVIKDMVIDQLKQKGYQVEFIK
ncbi:TraB/GumN family protein [Brevibacillus ruminantium]|uniref:TraB/GumN family protein n=1 Tax=Brevibacillus ruminantium TaxID=2950604 RepID=A0ABY4WH15_9BACL|nr:TraB/GumN family protein [Brevibacillus ruminantium]USG66159.1 TraB/GumN family protein [Brevibacillus ruminantium]